MMMKRWNEKEEESKYYKRRGFTRLPPSNSKKKEIYLIYVGDIEELFQDLKEEGDMPHL